jgi:hemolysin activation/secretion protein
VNKYLRWTDSKALLVIPALIFAIWIAHASAANENPATLPTLPPAGDRLSDGDGYYVDRFEFSGNHKICTPTLECIARKYSPKLPCWMTIADLEYVRIKLTLKYTDQGYINSGAVLENLPVDGAACFKIVEGRLRRENVQLTHLPPEMAELTQREPTTQPTEKKPWHLLNDDYVIDRVMLGAGPPLNTYQLRDQLELLRRDPNIGTVNAELAPGDVPGESVLNLTAIERQPFQIGVEYDNDRPPSVGAYELKALVSDSDLTGHGDALSASWDVLAGAVNTFAFDQDNDLSFDYMLPLTPEGLSVAANYTRSSDVVEEEPFTPVDITSKTDSMFATVRQPIINTVQDTDKQSPCKSPDEQLAAFFTVSSRYNRTFLLGAPFSFSDGVENGKQDVFALRPGLEYVLHTSVLTSAGALDGVLAMRGTFSVGVDGPNATIHANGTPDSRFFAFLGQAQYVSRLSSASSPDQPWTESQAKLRFNTQLTPDRLLTVEQFALGGLDTVRGYEENQFVTDEAVQGSAELSVPIANKPYKESSKDNDALLAVVPFFDAGYAWNRDNRTQTPTFIDSVGAGLVLTPDVPICGDRADAGLQASVYYGYRLKQLSHDEDDLQDMGIDFEVTVFMDF